MADETNTVLPDPKQAYDTIMQEVGSRAFFSRLAQHGINPANEKQAVDLLEMAGKLRAVSEDPTVKSAEDANDFVKQASNGLDEMLSQFGYANKSAEQAELSRWNAAISLADEPAIYNSILSLKSAQASDIRARLQS